MIGLPVSFSVLVQVPVILIVSDTDVASDLLTLILTLVDGV